MMGAKKKKWLSAIKNAFRLPPKRSDASPLERFPGFPTATDETQKASVDKPNWSSTGKSYSEEISEVPSSRGSKLALYADKGYSQLEEEQSKHALAVAVATAAAAEAAVAAAQAAAAVVRLSNSPAARLSFQISNVKEESPTQDWAAVRIQTAFRAYLARRALLALKGLVRLQALVRGQTIRRQSTITMRCMRALVRVQGRVRERRIYSTEDSQVRQQNAGEKAPKTTWTIKTVESSTENRKWEDNASAIEKCSSKQQIASKCDCSSPAAHSQQIVQQRKPKSRNNMILASAQNEYIDQPDDLHWGWSWLEQWMAAVPWEDRALHNHPPEDAQLGRSSDDHSPKSATPPTSNSLPKSAVKRHHSGPLPMRSPPTQYRPPAVKTSTINSHSLSSPLTPPSAQLSVRVLPASPRSVRLSRSEATSPSPAASISKDSAFASAASRRFGYRSSSVQRSAKDDAESMGSSPNYMSPTKAAKAKSKSYSNPRRTPPSPDTDLSASRSSPHPPWISSSVGSGNSRQLPKSPRAKGVFAPVKSARSVLSLQESSGGTTSSNGDTRSYR